MTDEERAKREDDIKEAVKTCLRKAEDILKANQSRDGVRALFAMYTNSEGTEVYIAGHALAVDGIYQKAITHILGVTLQKAVGIDLTRVKER